MCHSAVHITPSWIEATAYCKDDERSHFHFAATPFAIVSFNKYGSKGIDERVTFLEYFTFTKTAAGRFNTYHGFISACRS